MWLVRRLIGAGVPAREIKLPYPFQSVASDALKQDGAAAAALEDGAKPPLTVPKSSLLQRAMGRVGMKWRLLLGLLAAGTVAGAAAFVAMLVYYTVSFPHPMQMANGERAPIIRILARDGSVVAVRGTAHDYVPLDLVPKHLQEAVVATEDRRFFEHYGLDPVGMIRAAFANLRAGRFAQGGSTLTQQLAKNLFLTSDRTLSRKFAELGLAFWLEMRLSKAEILELYLNQVYFGGGAYGIEAASQRYFGKPARDLTLAEAALIAGLLKAPSKYSPSNAPELARARSRVVLNNMVEAGFISEQEEQKANDEVLNYVDVRSAKSSSDFGYVVDYILEQLPPILSAGHAELIVETTLDERLQRRAQEIVREMLTKRGPALGASQAALTVLDNHGGVQALVGGRDYTESQFNRAVKGKRQPGSAFKPFVYMAALEHGFTPDSIIEDAPINIGDWAPKNDNNQYVGPITLRDAMTQSVNTVAVRLNQNVGQGRVISVAERFGIKSELHDGPSLALGTSEVSLLELAGAYTAFANGGTKVEPYVINRVRISSGKVLFEHDNSGEAKAAETSLIGSLNDMLNAAVVYGTGKRAALPDHPAGGKTGTTQDFRDAWFMGFTGYLTAGVWVGNDNGKSMNRAMGGGLPAEIWNKVMRVALEGKPPVPLPGTFMADGLVASLPVGAGPRVIAKGERLPWLAPAEGPSGSQPPASHPKEGIAADFIERAISEAASGKPAEASSSEKLPWLSNSWWW